jgi:hypothetical protein
VSTLWLSDQRGHLVDWLTQRWVEFSGSSVDLATLSWLAGPTGQTNRIGPDFFERLAREESLRVESPAGPVGLMESFGSLAGPSFDPGRVQTQVREFYERTSEFDLDVWCEWSGLFRPFGKLLSLLFSRRLEQLNVPLSSLSTSRGLSSRIVRVTDPRGGRLLYTGWIRKNISSKETVYVGSYSVESIPGHDSPCVKVVFPLPNGNATVLMRPSIEPDGSLKLESAGRCIGDPGFYFLVRGAEIDTSVRYVRTFRETIRVYVSDRELHTDHVFTIWRQPFLRLHYRMRPRRHAAQQAVEPDVE